MGIRESRQPPGENLWHDLLTADSRLCVRGWLDPLTALAMHCVSKCDASELTNKDSLKGIHDRIKVRIPQWGLLKRGRGENRKFTELCFYYGCTTCCRAAIRRQAHSGFDWHHPTANTELIMAVYGNQVHLIHAWIGGIPWAFWASQWLIRVGYHVVDAALADDRVPALRALLALGLDMAVVWAFQGARLSDHESSQREATLVAYSAWSACALDGPTRIDEGRKLWALLRTW